MREHKSPTDAEEENRSAQTLKDSGWHISRYNLFARIPGTDMHAGVNLYKGICASYSVPEMYLYSVAEELPSEHPIFQRFRERGLITNHDEREALVREISEESGNDLRYSSFYVRENQASLDRNSKIKFLNGRGRLEEGLRRDVSNFRLKNGHFCSASQLFSVGIDEEGRLYKCWENMHQPEFSFGTAEEWDPEDPIRSAGFPDQLTCYINAALPFDDEECMECVWLPICMGGCPLFRLQNAKECVAYKEEPEAYVLALYRRMMQEQNK